MAAGQPVRIQADQSQTLADGIVQFKESVRGGAHVYYISRLLVQLSILHGLFPYTFLKFPNYI